LIVATVTGHLGKDATLRSAGNDQVLGFSVASAKKDRNGETTTWVDCSIWGRRGEALAQYLVKGTKVTVVGEFGTREHNGKTYLTLRADHVDLGGSSRGGSRGSSRDDEEPRQKSNPDPAPALPDDDDIPF
jgi:single-strand DNA-binding protein